MIDSENIYISDKNHLKKYFEDGCKPKENWGIGAVENFIFSKDTLQPLIIWFTFHINFLRI